MAAANTGDDSTSRSKGISVILLELGVASFGQDDSLYASKKFDRPVQSYRLVKSGALPEDIRQLVEKLRSQGSVRVNDASMAAVLRNSGITSSLMSEEQQKSIQDTKPSQIVKAGFARNEQEATLALRDFAIELSSTRVKEASERLDLHITQSINALDELDKIINTIGTRMREWYGLHFPELELSFSEMLASAPLCR